MVSQMARSKNLSEPFMAHLENLYNIPCKLQKKIVRTITNTAYIAHSEPILKGLRGSMGVTTFFFNN